MDATTEVRAVKTIRGEEMHHAWANKLVQAWLAGNARESRFQEARLRTPFCIVGVRLRDLTRTPNKS